MMKFSDFKSLVEIVNSNPDKYVLYVFFNDGKNKVILSGEPRPILLAKIQDMDFVKISNSFAAVNNICDATVVPRDGVVVETYSPSMW